MAVSFAAQAKSEICRSVPHKQCCALAECFGVLLYCNSFRADGFKVCFNLIRSKLQIPVFNFIGKSVFAVIFNKNTHFFAAARMGMRLYCSYRARNR